MRKINLVPVLLAALAVAPVAAAQGATWSQPQSITSGIPQLAQPTIAFGQNGRAVLSARLTDRAFGYPSNGFSRLFGQQPDGSFVGRGRITLAAPPAAYGQTRLALLRLPLAEGDVSISDLEHPATSLGYGFGRSGGTLEVEADAYRRLTKRADRDNAALGANGRGDAAAAWVEHFSGHDHLVVATRRAGHAFSGPSVIIGSGLITAPSVAVAGNGDIVVAYQHSVPRHGRTADRRVDARVRRAGHSWGKEQSLGASLGFSYVSAAAAANGRMVVAWGTQDIGEEANLPWTVSAAIRPAGPHSFHSGQLLERSQGLDRPAGRVVAAMDAQGTSTVGWSAVSGTRFPYGFPVRAATAGSSLRFGPPQTLADNGALDDVAAEADGVAIVAWANLPDQGDNQTTDQIRASLRTAPTAPFAGSEPVSPVEGAADPRAAFDPLTHQPALTWVRRPPGGATQTLRYSERAG